MAPNHALPSPRCDPLELQNAADGDGMCPRSLPPCSDIKLRVCANCTHRLNGIAGSRERSLGSFFFRENKKEKKSLLGWKSSILSGRIIVRTDGCVVHSASSRGGHNHKEAALNDEPKREEALLRPHTKQQTHCT